jgi:hypothetical protein
MAYCPSMDWDRYCDANDPPEECPVCKGANYDLDTDAPVCAAHPDFCSAECAAEYDAQCAAEAAAEAERFARELEDEAAMAALWRKEFADDFG